MIQVLNQLETGWWDGVMGNIRGWFPSNYCAVIPVSEVSDSFDHPHYGDVGAESGADDDYYYYDDARDGAGYDSDGSQRDELPILPIEGARRSNEPEEAAFWIPQATADGRLFYYNTLTGYSTMELPLETPTSANETGPRDRTNIFVPEQTRPPTELMARSIDRFEDDEYDDGSASETEGESLLLTSHDSISRRRQSSMSDGVSPATSLDSMNSPPITKPQQQQQQQQNHAAKNAAQPARSATPGGIPLMGTTGTPTATSTTTTTTASTAAAASTKVESPQERQPAASSSSISSTIPRYFLDTPTSVPITWATLVENMRQAIDAYRQAILDGDRAQYVSRAEDISDHLRMLLAAGSDTTDNHSGNPSIISTNKALYPHFRDMMSKFSKLVLSSHIAAADWPGPDSASKCLHEADGVLHGVYGYVDVARQQRGGDIRRLVPGFVADSNAGGHWQNNNLTSKDPTSFLDQENARDSQNGPSMILDSNLVSRIEEVRKSVTANARQLEGILTLKDSVVTPSRHTAIGDTVCSACSQVVEVFRPWMSLVESIDLSPFGSAVQNPQLGDFALQKQRAYDGISDLVVCCQTIAAPLADEWAVSRADSLETRLNNARIVSRQLENYMSQIGFSLTLLQEQSQNTSITTTTHAPDKSGYASAAGFAHTRMRSDSKAKKPRRESIDIPESYELDDDDIMASSSGSGKPQQGNLDKAQRFFGQPVPRDPVPQPDEALWFLSLDHESEVFYDTKGEVTQLKCGTLTGLVEQLTRHDKLDTYFRDTFLLTYRSFTTAPELFEMLMHRYTLQPPYGLEKSELKYWEEHKLHPIRIRVVNILKTWFETYWMEPNDEPSNRLIKRIYSFVKDIVATAKIPGSKPLVAIVDQRVRGQDTSAKRLVPTVNQNAPQPIIPKSLKKIKFLDIDPTEFARQLTIIESRLYGKIRSTECLNKTWQKKVGPEDPDPAANVKALILHSNQLTNWVAEMILTQADVKRRVVVIKHFVSIAEVC